MKNLLLVGSLIVSASAFSASKSLNTYEVLHKSFAKLGATKAFEKSTGAEIRSGTVICDSLSGMSEGFKKVELTAYNCDAFVGLESKEVVVGARALFEKAEGIDDMPAFNKSTGAKSVRMSAYCTKLKVAATEGLKPKKGSIYKCRFSKFN